MRPSYVLGLAGCAIFVIALCLLLFFEVNCADLREGL